MRRRPLCITLCLATVAALLGCASVAPAPAQDWFIFLEAGKKTPDHRAAVAAVAAMQRGHIDNFKRLFAQGQLLGAGPLAYPTGIKRGIVTVRAPSLLVLANYFQSDDSVRQGYMLLNAVPAAVHKGLHTQGIDASKVEELRIVQIARGTAVADATTTAARQALLQRLTDSGTVGAWYTLQSGPVAEVLFAKTTNTPQLEAAFAGYPGLGTAGVTVAVWGQWLSPGVVR